MTYGHIRLKRFMNRSAGVVTGSLLTDAKSRMYRQEYECIEVSGDRVRIRRKDGYGDEVEFPSDIPLTPTLVAFLGFYSGDGSKGSEVDGRMQPSISVCTIEPNLVRYSVETIKSLFAGSARFTFSLGEDAAYFLEGEGYELLKRFYEAQGMSMPATPLLSQVKPELDEKDKLYLSETRDVPEPNEHYLAFYYVHKKAMEAVLRARKAIELESVSLREDGVQIKIVASVRRPFKKGARLPGGSSRADEVHVGGLNGMGELLLKMIHEVEDSILRDSAESAGGLVEWSDVPSKVGELLDLSQFFTVHNYGVIDNQRPKVLRTVGSLVEGQWKRSTLVQMRRSVRVCPLLSYTSGLYLAEGTSDKTQLFTMFQSAPSGLALGFTSSEGTSIELMLRALSLIFPEEHCLSAWKVKVGSQYFPELVVVGMKQGVPMLRGGESGDGKLRTMEISLSIKEWALDVARAAVEDGNPLLARVFSEKFSHVEPTGAGVARIDFWASSSICRWYFPLLMYAVFGEVAPSPSTSFYT